MRIAYITAGAAGMYCGSCLRDNTLARALINRGHDVLLVPTYTPTRTDEPNVSQPRVFLGGIKLYLQYKSAIFRYAPRFANRWLDSPRLLNWAVGLGMKTDAAGLGGLTVSMLSGQDGPHRHEFGELAKWLNDDVRPDVIDISNGLLLGVVAPLRRTTKVPIVCTLSGEDIFLESLPEPWRRQAIDLMQRRVAEVDGFITFNRYYADFMSDYLRIPQQKLFQIPLGINLDGHGGNLKGCNRPQGPARRGDGLAIGYLARICPEKGLHLLCDAFRMLHEQPQFAECRLRIAGYLGARDRSYFEGLQRQIDEWGLADSVDYLGELDRDGKIQFLQSLDVFSVPTVYRESKGLPIIEAWANGLPVVQPWHGSFTELVNAAQGGILVPPNNPQALADGLARLLENEPLRRELGQRGCQAVEKHFTADHMAAATIGVYEQLVRG